VTQNKDKRSLTISNKVGYGIGDFGFNIMFSGVSLYMLYFYTDVLGISPKTAGLIFMVALIWDGVSDPLMGLIAQRTKTKWGSYRPFILFGALPLVVCYLSMFFAPAWELNAIVVYAFATHILFRTAYTVVSIPYSSLMASMTQNSMERNTLAGFRMIGATVGALTVAFLTLKLASIFGEGDIREGFKQVALLFASVALVALLIVFFTTKETIDIERRKSPSLKSALGMLKENTPFIVLFSAILVCVSSTTVFTKVLVYFFKYNLDAESAIGLALVSYIGMISIMTPVWMFITQKTSKRFVWIAGSVMFAIGLVLFAAVPVTKSQAYIVVALCGLGASAFPLTFWSMLPDTVEFGEWKSGVRAESFVFGLVSLAQKVALGIAVGILGFLLDGVGFIANEVQTPETSQALIYIMTLIPAAGALASAVLIWFYPLNNQLHSQIVAEIEARQS
jgi:GPH family glycoside/pentoside/hexuronide:cation symporter